ncbi:NAD kinase [Terrihalobacillus insolitus]|uniref:NAD kinase n=1 Tax=Terrihalobacillus insolitus TaxID=2950438 RepID=UPI0023414006|nr:NAD kinase [Terrihalobacillus insolitus]MDC3412951.1 NAD kinase [Terrihalobacillus insolitus]
MVKTFQIIDRGDPKSREIAERYKKSLLKGGLTISQTPDLVISIGGDGTMLKGFRDFYNPSTAFVGLHTGTLGFYADWSKNESELLLKSILQEQPQLEKCPLIKGEFKLQSGEKKEYLAMNEIVIKSKSISTMILDVKINGEKFESFRGDGILISTPSGSTAYSHSLWGSVIHPTIEAMQVIEMASINNSVFRTLNRSLVLPKNQQLMLDFPEHDDDSIIVGIDGKEYPLNKIQAVNISVAEEKINFARYRTFPFWKRVMEKFLKEY